MQRVPRDGLEGPVFDRARASPGSSRSRYHSPRANSPPNLIPTVAIYSPRRLPADRRAVSRSVGRGALNRTLRWAAEVRREGQFRGHGFPSWRIRLRQRARRDACGASPPPVVPSPSTACNFRTDARYYDQSTDSQFRASRTEIEYTRKYGRVRERASVRSRHP